MNDLIKYLFILLFVYTAHADQGMLDTVTQVDKFGTNDTLKASFTKDSIYTISKSSTLYNTITKYDKNSTVAVKTLSTAQSYQDIIATSNNVYVLENDKTIRTYNTDINQSSNSFTSSKTIHSFGISTNEQYLFLATVAGLDIVKISTMQNVATLFSDNNIRDLKVSSNYLYLANDWQGLKVVDISNPELATTVSATAVGDIYTKIALEDKYLYTLGDFGLRVFDITSSNAPVEKTTLSLSDLNTSNSTIFVSDFNAYITSNNTLKVYDTADKTRLTAVNIIGTAIPNANDTFVENQRLYVSNTNGLTRYSAFSDFKNTFVDANTTSAKTKQNLIDGVFGMLDNNDTDFIKVSLPSEKFSATVDGIKDLNISIINSVGQTVYNIVNSQKSTNINLALDSGTYYLSISSTSNTVGEYSIKAVFSSDDWTDNKNSAYLIGTDENIKGTISNGADYDIFRIDTHSSGTLNISNNNPALIDFNLTDSAGNTIQGHKTPDALKSFTIDSSGVYFIKAYALAQDVKNQSYTFRANLSHETNVQSDDSSIALYDLNRSSITSSTYSNIQTGSSFIYAIENGSLVQFDKSLVQTAKLTLSGESLVDYTQIGDYIYAITQSKFLVLNTSLTIIGTITGSSSYKKIKINATTAYIMSNSSTSIEIIDISQKETPSRINTLNTSNTINDFDIKTNFSLTPTNHFVTNLYLATNNGLVTWDVTDTNNLVKLSSYIAPSHSQYKNVVVDSPYIYTITDGNNSGGINFEILYAKKATALPKLRSDTALTYITSKMLINGDYAYFINNNTSLSNNYLNVIQIKDKTHPTLVEIDLTRAEDIAIQSSQAYILSDTKTFKTFDIANDYADTKQHAHPISLNKQIAGTLSVNRPDQDLFYLLLDSDSDLYFEANSTNTTNFTLYTFITDTVDANFSVLNETNASIHAQAGEYYIKVSGTNDTLYNFKVNATQDDYTDTFTTAQDINLNHLYDANISAKDKDIVKFTVPSRGSLKYTTDNNVTVSLFYDDFITQPVSTNATAILNPGTYYAVMESNSTTAYSFNATFSKTDILTQTNGFDGITNFKATHIVYGNRYIYIIDENNHFYVYNHLLQKVEDIQLPQSNTIFTAYDYQNFCGKSIFYDNSIYTNTLTKIGNDYVCGGFKSIKVDNLQQDDVNSLDLLESIPNKTIYTRQDILNNSYIGTTIPDITLVNIDNDFAYNYSVNATAIYKTSYKDLFYDTNHYVKIYADFNLSALNVNSISDIKDIKNDGDIDLLSLNSTLYIYTSNPEKEIYTDTDNNVSTPDVLTYKVVESNITKSFLLEGEITDTLINRSSKLLYVTNKNSTNLKIIDYKNFTETNVSMSTVPNGLFQHQDKLYITSNDYGLLIYQLPLSSTSKPIQTIPNVGKSISRPFTFTGSTFNYISNNQPSVYFLSDTFFDGVTSGTYTNVESNSINDKTFEGCFIATAAYGSYLEKHVKVLRDFRDQYLLTNTLGRKFVHLYYTYSPAIATEIAKSEIAKTVIRVALLPMIYIIKYPLVSLILLLLSLLTFMLFKFRTNTKVISHEKA